MDENRKNNHFADAEFVELPMIPLRGLSVFPNMVLHFDIGREKSINALEKAMVSTSCPAESSSRKAASHISGVT